jgi:hypothetical protein
MARGPEPAHPVRLTSEEYSRLQHISRLRKAPHGEVVRAKILVAAYEHPDWDNQTISRHAGCFHTWQKPTDPRFLEKAVPVLDLYTQATALVKVGHVIVCVDEKPSIQARQLQGGMPGDSRQKDERYAPTHPPSRVTFG